MTRLFIVAALAASLIAPAGHAEDLTIGIVTATRGPLAAESESQVVVARVRQRPALQKSIVFFQVGQDAVVRGLHAHGGHVLQL
jgi:hypothetical protein